MMPAFRSNGLAAAMSASVLFAMLWLPLGQFDFMFDHWMKVGTFAAPFFLVVYFAAAAREPGLGNATFMAVLFLVSYIIHQFEEHWIDALGNHYAFYSYVNSMVRSLLGVSDPSLEPLTRSAIYVINTTLVWLVGVIAVVRSCRASFPVFALASISLVNGVTHIAAALATWSYNPGLLTSLLLFLPLSSVFFARHLRHGSDVKPLVVVSLIWSIAAHVLMVAGLLAANVYGVISQLAYFLLLGVWSLVPLFLFRSASEVVVELRTVGGG